MARSLYQCGNAIVQGRDISCNCGHSLSSKKGGAVELRRLIQGTELEIAICQDCQDYDYLGPNPKKREKGWKPNQYERSLYS
jgi:hypothetical protein